MLYIGGNWDNTSNAGLWNWNSNWNGTNTNSNVGGRNLLQDLKHSTTYP